ncbi:putative Polyprotein [Phytophthora cinnamomi]|uniref:putative Polyprotein n=1 Tax=Phytophthora cinnamomi TaxID=4785 RepID=UPI003559DECE|nr:putative Polyprotein [Phytophthora cinnamomi]
MKLDIDDFTGKATEDVGSWLETVSIAAQSQFVLNGEEWSPVDVYYGVAAHLKGPANSLFRALNKQTAPERRNLLYLERKLREVYGSRETSWDIQNKLMARRQLPGERLLDYSSSLTELGAGHPGLAPSFYVDAFARGLDNPISSQTVTSARMPTLEQAVSLAIDNCGRYG